MSTTMVGRQSEALGFERGKTVKFGTLLMISFTQSCLSKKLFFIDTTPRAFGLGESNYTGLFLLTDKNVHVWLPNKLMNSQTNLANILYYRQ